LFGIIGERGWSHGSYGSTKSSTSNAKRLDARETSKNKRRRLCIVYMMDSTQNINHNNDV
jgi:hypothetical protein